MPKGTIKKVFPGGNTSLGFYSFYNYILDQQEARRIIVLKGGPGVGKSTFMRRIADEMQDRGYNVEHMHCSSDNNSLDGVVIPAIKVALLDGTSPHVVDPKNPGAVDEIIHLGDFWNEDGIRANRESIMENNREVGRIYSRAYRYLKAAASIYEDTAVINSWSLDRAKVNQTGDELAGKIFGNEQAADKEGWERHLFASAITPGGLKNYLETVFTTGRIYVLKGQQGTGTELALEKIRRTAVEKGYFAECYHCALMPDKLEHLVIPELDVSLTTDNKYHCAQIIATEEYNFDQYLNQSILEDYQNEIEYNTATFDMLLNKTIATISKAKALHDLMESFYIPYMDFDAVQRCWESTLARILAYADE